MLSPAQNNFAHKTAPDFRPEVVAGTVETLAEQRLRGLVVVIRREHDLASQAAERVVLHAVACGEALIEAKGLVAPGGWIDWCEANLPFGKRYPQINKLMRLASLKEHVDPELSFTANVQLLSGLQRRSSATRRSPEGAKEEALRLYAQGGFSWRQIAGAVGVSQATVREWADPEYRRRKYERNEAKRSAKRAAGAMTDRASDPSYDERAFRYGEPGRAAVGRAVRRLAEVQGRERTSDALLDLVAVASAWQRRLGRPGPAP